jgi:predicted methyltransferase
MRYLILTVLMGLLLACQSEQPEEAAVTDETSVAAPAPQPADAGHSVVDGARLNGILAAQDAETKARYEYRHPAETLAFFEIGPGMTVMEALPGRGWYSKILLPYLGSEGRLIAANYAQEMWPLFGFFSDDFIKGMETWVSDWPAGAEDWQINDSARISAFVFGSMPEEFAGTADRVLLIRALHNMANFEDEGDFLTQGLNDAFNILKPGGIAGVVQHQAPDEMSDEWADGSHGYLKKSFVIERMTDAGFEFVGEIDINENDRDQPGDDDVVWRLPPSLQTSADDEKLRTEMQAIGESNRMTLKFRKPE